MGNDYLRALVSVTQMNPYHPYHQVNKTDAYPGQHQTNTKQ